MTEEDIVSARQRIKYLEEQLAASEERSAALEQKCKHLSERNFALEEECDLLAVELDRVRNSSAAPMQSSVCVSDMNTSFSHLSIDGDGCSYASREVLRVEAVCGAVNPLCAAYATLPSDEEVVVVGGADKCIKVVCVSSAAILQTHTLTSPVISMDAYKNRVIFGGMDGSIGMLLLTNSTEGQVISVSGGAAKYVIATQWSACGSFAARASHDGTVVLYRYEDNSVNGGRLVIVTTLALDAGPPECLTFAVGPPECLTFADALTLVIGSRNTCSLLYLNCHTLEQRLVSMNEQEFDRHISFTPLHMSVYGNMLLVATDKHLIVLYELGSNRRLRIFSGHSSGDYARPKVAWDADGKYIYCNSDADPYIYVYSVATAKIVDVLKHHNNCGVTRYICAHPTRHSILTTGADKSLVMCEEKKEAGK